MKRALQLLSVALALFAASALAQPRPGSLIAVSGDGQVVRLGEDFPQRVSVKVLDADGRPRVDALVSFLLKTGGWYGIPGPSGMWTHIDFPVPAGFRMYERTDASGVATAPAIRSKRGTGESWVEASVYDAPTNSELFTPIRYTVVLPPGVPAPNYQALWWAEGVNPEAKSQRGWGVTVAQNGERLFVVRYDYRADGRPTWTLSPETRWTEGFGSDNGSYNFLPTGSPYYAYDPSRFRANPLDKGMTFLLGSAASLTTAEPRSQFSSFGWGSMNLQPYRSGPVASTPIPEAEGMWWGGAGQDGWGLAVMNQGGGKYFVVWYTYDADGERTWFAMSDGVWSAANRTWSGRVTRSRSTQPGTTAPEYDGAYVVHEDVGSFELRFDDAHRGRFTYEVEGHRGSMAIERFAF